MSRIGLLPITIPQGVSIVLSPESVVAKGPKGELSYDISRYVKVEQEDNMITISIPEAKIGDPLYESQFGLARSLVNNIVVGVSEGYKKELEMKGIGYRAVVQNGELILNVGYSHQVTIPKIEGVVYQVIDSVNIIVEGIDKQKVGQVAANIRKVRPPEPYKGKGIRYKGEIVRRKSGKAGKGAKGAK